MRRLMQRASIVDAETEMSLRIIDRFDRLVAERVDVGALSAHAAEITGRAVGVDEWLTGTQLRCCSAGTPLDDATAVAREVHGAAIAARLRGRRALALELHDGRAVLAASVEQAPGRSGVVWAHREDGRDWSIADQIAVERLALAVSARALEEHERASARQQQRVALEVLVSETHTVEEARQLARRAGLDPPAGFVVVAVAERPAGAQSPDTLLATVLRRLTDARVTARGVIVDHLAVVVIDAAGAWREPLERLCADVRAHAWSVHFGASERARVDGLMASLAQAKQALLLGTLLEDGGDVTSSADLGILRLLASIPSEEVERDADYQRIGMLEGSSGGVTDIALLAAYCDSGSLRKTAERLFLHHTSVHYRVRRLERVLGFDLGTSRGRMRALLAIRLFQIDQLRRSS